MNKPLAIYVAYHKDFVDGLEIYSRIYKLLCRDSKDPLADGLDIPVYFTTGIEGQYDPSRAQQIAVIVLAENNMWRDKTWYGRIKTWCQTSQCKVIPIVLGENAEMLFQNKFSLEYIRFNTFSLLDNWSELETRIYDVLIRLISHKVKEKLSIFISHSKKDKDQCGVILAKELKKYLQEETKLNPFFDVNDILYSESFCNQIIDSVKHSAIFIFLNTSTYSTREWCRKELLYAKRYSVPIIAVRMINGDTARVFPYIGNVPGTIYGNDWKPIVNLALRTALDYAYETQFLQSIAHSDSIVLPCAPEAASLRNVARRKHLDLLYPEPPLGDEELRLLKDLRDNISFYTPMEYLAKEMDLKEKNIAVSISESSNLSELGMGIEVLDDLMIEIPKHILKANGKLVYGGDLRDGGFTELFRDLACQYGLREHAEGDVEYFTNFFAWPMTTKITQEEIDSYQRDRVQCVLVAPSADVPQELKKDFEESMSSDKLLWKSHSLTKMRREMEQSVSARIIAGGKIYGFSGSMAGVLEEFKIAQEMKHPCFVLGGFGGAGGLLAAVLKGEQPFTAFEEKAMTDEQYMLLQSLEQTDYQWLQGKTLIDLDNGLTESENKVLFTSCDVIEIVSLILKGLKNKLR